MPRRVALDPGSLHGDVVRAAALEAVTEDAELEVLLVGTDAPDHARLTAVDAAAGLAKGVDPAVAVRGRADLPVRVALQLLADGRIDGVVSASSAEVLLAAARFTLPRRRGVRDGLLAAAVQHGARRLHVLDVSGHPGTPAAAFVHGVQQLRARRSTVLTCMSRPNAPERERIEVLHEAGLDVTAVPVDDWLDVDTDLVVCDGPVGRAMVATLAAVVPADVEVSRALGFDAPPILHADFVRSAAAIGRALLGAGA